MAYNPLIHHRRSIRLQGYDYSSAGLYFITFCCQDRAHLFGSVGAVLRDRPNKNNAESDYQQSERIDISYHNRSIETQSYDELIEENQEENRIEGGCDIEEGGHNIEDANAFKGGHYIEEGGHEGPPRREMHLNDAGKMVAKWYFELENKYPDKRCHEMIIMPNHFHCIIENKVELIGENDCEIDDKVIHDNLLNEDLQMDYHNLKGTHDLQGGHEGPPRQDNRYGMHNKKYDATIGDAMKWFKTMTTNEYIRGVKTLGWTPFRGKVWERNYFEHIIRSNQSYENISNYIINNPEKWEDDKFNSIE